MADSHPRYYQAIMWHLLWPDQPRLKQRWWNFATYFRRIIWKLRIFWRLHDLFRGAANLAEWDLESRKKPSPSRLFRPDECLPPPFNDAHPWLCGCERGECRDQSTSAWLAAASQPAACCSRGQRKTAYLRPDLDALVDLCHFQRKMIVIHDQLY